jgi:hydroxymethylpyrimidine pyrophosphatase-like HAD family hydrolase
LRILTWDEAAIDEIVALCHSSLGDRCSFEIYMNADGTRESLGIFAPPANKGSALNLVMAQLGIAREQVVTMGDNFNDVPMFACSATSVAMANGPVAVRQRATLVAPSNDEEGIAWALRELQIV